MTPFMPVAQVVRTAEDVETTQVSAAYNLGKMAKESGSSRSTILSIMDGMSTMKPQAQDEFRRDWLRGWQDAEVKFSAVQCNYPQAVSVMSNEQLAAECAQMRKVWWQALSPNTNEAQWQRALASEEKRRDNAQAALNTRATIPVLV